MGNVLLSRAGEQLRMDDGLLAEYREATLHRAAECWEALKTDFQDNVKLTGEQFDEIFGPIFADTEAHFEMYRLDNVETVNVLETLAVIYLLTTVEHKTFDVKLGHIFRLFNADKSGMLTPTEFKSMVECSALGLCKFGGAKSFLTSRVSEVSTMLSASYHRMFRDQPISLEQLKHWIASEPEVIGFLNNFFDARLVASTRANVDETLQAALASFRSAAARYEHDNSRYPELSTNRVVELLRKLPGAPPTPSELARFVQMLSTGNTSSSEKVSYRQFETAIGPWITFSILDTDGSGTLDQYELKTLIWIQNGVEKPEPLDGVVYKVLREVDHDRTGSIGRMEWVAYNIQFDADTGEVLLDNQLKEDFERMDIDQSGSITTDEMATALQEKIDLYINQLASQGYVLSAQSRELLDLMIQSVSAELIQEIDTSGNGAVEWLEYKKSANLILDKIRSVQKYTLTLLRADQRGK